MSIRTSHFRASWLVGFGALLSVPALLAALAPRDRAPLAPADLVRSRGNNQSLVLTVLTCNGLQGNQPCTQQYQACNTCSTYGYTTVQGGSHGGYVPGAPQGGNCGTLYSGVCQANLTCSQVFRHNGCTLPPGPVGVQPASVPGP